MTSSWVVVVVRWAIAALGAGTLIDAILVAQTASGTAATVDFLSSVTAQSNIISVVVFALAGATALRRRAVTRGDRRAVPRRGVDLLRAVAVATLVGMSVLFLFIYGPTVFADPGQVNTASLLLHVVIPVLAVVEWLVFPPEQRLDVRGILLVLVFPIVWFAFTFIRGAATGHYVYEFLDPANAAGVQGVLAMTVLIVMIFFLAGVVVFLVQRSQRVRRSGLG